MNIGVNPEGETDVKHLQGLVFGFVLWGLGYASSALEISAELQQKVQQELEIAWQAGPKLGETMFLMREAGGSYLPEIVAPVDVDRYQALDKRRKMVGVYWMDLTYASAFHEAEPAAQCGQAICRLLDNLGYPQPELERRYREALEQIDQPGGEDRLWALFKEQNADVKWREMLQNSDGLELVVDGVYGYLLEGLHLATAIAIQSEYEPNYMRFVGDTRNAFRAYNNVLALFANEPELTALVDQNERVQFNTVLLNIIGDMPEIGAEQVNALRALTARTRNSFVE